MADIVHEVSIHAPAEQVFDAIATQDGLTAWWTADTEADARVGSTALFGFSKRALVFRMQIEALDRARRVAWRCTGDHPEWKDTRVTFDLRPAEEPGATTVRFVHGGWRATDGWLGPCSYTWAHILGRLKQYAETGQRVPYFTGQ